ncbi:hypothetical protein BCVP_CDS0208 [Bacillus phage BC-VP]|nr:hypothetical protein BCVP_CDS0208 [Bacillus phage BC-VP]
MYTFHSIYALTEVLTLTVIIVAYNVSYYDPSSILLFTYIV